MVSLRLGVGLGRLTATRTKGVRSAVASPFRAAALRLRAAANAPRTVTTSSAITISTSTGASTINGRTLAQGGLVATPSIPDGYSGPMNVNSRWIVTKPAAAQVETNRTFAPGNSKLFVFTGRQFDFKASAVAGLSFSVRWSEDGGLTWEQTTSPTVLSTTCWALVDFGSAASRIVEIICEDQLLQTYGWNFDNGLTPAAYTDTTLPLITMLGDSYVFCQGSRQDGVANGQQATLGMARQMAQILGVLQIRNHGFRTNGFSNDHSAVQSKFKDRIDLPSPADHTLSEGLVMGSPDLIVIPSSINDASSAYDGGTRYADVVAAFTRLRALQPTALIVFPIGANPPDIAEPANWINDCKTAFQAVFGATTAAQVANGALLVDGSRLSGAGWIPAGAQGSSIYFPQPGGDMQHPTPAGHAYLAGKYAAGALALADAVIAATGGSGGGSTTYYRVTSTGDQRVTSTGDIRRTA